MTKKKRVIYLTQWFDPEPCFKGIRFVNTLASAGYEVEVVTGFPNYPSGSLYEGYALSPFKREYFEKFIITRVPLYPSHDNSAFRRSLNYLSFCFSALVYLTLFARKADVIYAYNPPITVGFVACLAKFLRRSKVINDVQDLWPDTLTATGMIRPGLLLNLISSLSNWVYRYSDQIVVLSPGFKRKLIERGNSKGKIHVIYNWSLEDNAGACDQSSLNTFKNADGFKVLFAGNMGPAQGLETILRAAEQVHSTNPDVHFYFLVVVLRKII